MSGSIVSLTPAEVADGGLWEAFGHGLQLPQRNGPVIDLARLPFDMAGTAKVPRVAPSRGWAGLAQLPWNAEPFDFAAGAGVLGRSGADALLLWLETAGDWKLNDGGFYKADERVVDETGVMGPAAALFGEDGLSELTEMARLLFRRDLRLHGPVVAHRLLDGHGIGVHTDQPAPGEETHRVVITLLREGPSEAGGHFVLFSASQPRAAAKILSASHNSAVAFELGAQSAHAVTRPQGRPRYSLVLSFKT